MNVGEFSFCMQARDMCPHPDKRRHLGVSHGSVSRVDNMPKMHAFKTMNGNFNRGDPDEVVILRVNFQHFCCLSTERLETPSSRHAQW